MSSVVCEQSKNWSTKPTNASQSAAVQAMVDTFSHIKVEEEEVAIGVGSEAESREDKEDYGHNITNHIHPAHCPNTCQFQCLVEEKTSAQTTQVTRRTYRLINGPTPETATMLPQTLQCTTHTAISNSSVSYILSDEQIKAPPHGPLQPMPAQIPDVPPPNWSLAYSPRQSREATGSTQAELDQAKAENKKLRTALLLAQRQSQSQQTQIERGNVNHVLAVEENWRECQARDIHAENKKQKTENGKWKNKLYLFGSASSHDTILSCRLRINVETAQTSYEWLNTFAVGD